MVRLLATTAITGGDCVSWYVKSVWAPNGEVVVDGRALESYRMEADSVLGPVAELRPANPT